MFKIKYFHMLVAFLFLLFVNLGFSITYYVSLNGSDQNDGKSWEASFLTISKALTNAVSGDNIWVAAGSYKEGKTITLPQNISLFGGFKGIENDISQRDIVNNKTIIDGENSYQCIYNYGVIDGLYITNGKSSDYGGGVYNNHGMITNCTVDSNSVTGDGGGVYTWGGTVTNCTVYSNSATRNGGGVYNSSGTVTNCTVYSNSADSGGGIYNWNGTDINCFIYSNSATRDGGGIYNWKGTIINCTLYSNSATRDSGGIYNWNGTITNCTLYSNSATRDGSGIYNKFSCTVTNCIVWKNSCSDIYGTSNVTYSCFGESNGKNGNIRGNPLFVNTSGDMANWDFHLQNGSPCIDNGVVEGSPNTDMERNTRPGADGKVCMGAFESPDDYIPGEIIAKRIYVSKSGNNTTGTSWETACSSIINAIDKTGDDLGEIWIAEGEYIEGKTINNPLIVDLIGGFKGFENDISQRDVLNNKAIINGVDAYQCINNFGVIDGFFITKGKTSEYGGGVYNSFGTVTNCFAFFNSADYGGGVYNSSGTVTNCTVSSNTASDSGGGIYSEEGTVTNCAIYNNSAAGEGGGVENDYGIVTNCTVYSNFANDEDACGGGIYNYEGTATNCTVYSNSANLGGGIYNWNGAVTNCIVNSNSVDGEDACGGGVFNIDGTFTNCIVYSNWAAGEYGCGGGVDNWGGAVTNCMVHSNSATGDGGGVYNDEGAVTNCTVYSNSAEWDGGGVYNYFGRVTNSIVWKNFCSDIYELSSVTHSCFGESDGKNGNIRGNPFFVNTSGDLTTWDFHLQNGSPCIDSGDITKAPSTDIDGNARPGADGKVCMGTYESPDEYTSGTIMPPKRFYVSKAGNNTTGLSWETAFSSIINAINKMGDDLGEVWIANGVYKEGETIINPQRICLIGGFNGIEKAISQKDILNNKTIIDGENSYRCIKNSGVLDGLYITNGQSNGCGGGVFNIAGAVTNCTVYSNSANLGGGIYNWNGAVTYCVVYSNSVDGEDACGGGIFNIEGTFTNCIVYSNSAAGEYGCGGGVDNWGGAVTNCMLHSNSATGDGGGVYNDEGAVINCTVYSNSAEWDGGGVYNKNSGTVTNCIVWNNSVSDVYELSGVIYSCFGESDGKNGNIRGNPLFVNTSGDLASWDFHLQNGSLCIDSGVVEGAPNTDIEGHVRPGSDGKVCMGTYESPDEFTTGTIMPPKRFYVSKAGNNTTGLSWETAFSSIINAIEKMGDDVGEIWIADGVYKEGETIINPQRINLLGGFKGFEKAVSQKDILNNKTIIDGENTYGCIKNSGVIDGFYITKGQSSGCGGGIVNISGAVTNCTVYSNSANCGGGVYNDDGTLTNCSLYSNSAPGEDTFGGGLYNWWGAVTNCMVYSNSADYGGGVYNNAGTLKNCAVYSNSAPGEDTCGGGVYNWGGTVTNCTVHSNSANSGGGVYNDVGGVNNCTVYSNSAPGEDACGGGAYNWFGAFTNCTMYSNSATYDGGGAYNYYGPFINCIVWANLNSDISGHSKSSDLSYSCFSESAGENGNINQDPLFVNSSGDVATWDFHLQDGSPCIDAGNPALEYNDGCLPPGKKTIRNDMGVYGGPQNCGWNVPKPLPTRDALVDYLLGRTETLDGDLNGDGIVDAADLVSLILVK